MARVGDVAPPRSSFRVVAVVPHVVMMTVMAATMIEEHSLTLAFAGAAVLLLLSFGYAKSARDSESARDQILDLWATGLVLIAHQLAPTSGHHWSSPGGSTLVVVITASWLVARVWSSLARPTAARTFAGAICAGCLAVMIVAH